MVKVLSFSFSPSSECSGLISFRTGWFDVFAVQGTLKSFLLHYNSKSSILWCSALWSNFHTCKESACQCRRYGFDPWVGKILWRRKWQLTPVFLLGKFQGQRSLAGYSPWGQTRLSDWHSHTLINVEKMFSRSTSKIPLTATAFGERSWWGRPFLPSYPFQCNLDFLIIHMNCTFKMLHRDRWTVSLRLFYIYFPLRKERREKEKKTDESNQSCSPEISPISRLESRPILLLCVRDTKVKGKTTKKRAHSLCEGTHHPVGKILTQIIAMQEGKFKNWCRLL